MTSPAVKQISIHISFRGSTSKQITIDEGTTVGKLFESRYPNSTMKLHKVLIDGDTADWNHTLKQDDEVAISVKQKYKV